MNYFYMPTKVYEERDCIKKHGKELCSWGKRALIVTGRHSSKANGSLSEVENALKDMNRDYVIFDEVEENPSTETVVKAAKIGLENNTDFVIAIGGGSPMDAAKAIALLIENKSPCTSYLFDKEAPSGALPVIAVPTTCGTGSEVTGVSVLTVHEKRTKCSIPHRIFPKMALLDGKYLKTASKEIINDTALDALSHLLESYINTKSDSYCKMLAEEGLRSWSGIRAVLEGKREADDEDYDALMHAAALAGMSIAHAGTTLPHALSYAVTYEIRLTHGRAVGQFLSGFLEKASAEDREHVLKLSGFSDLGSFDEFFENVFGRIPLEAELKKRIIDEVYSRTEKLQMVPFPVDRQTLADIVNYGQR